MKVRTPFIILLGISIMGLILTSGAVEVTINHKPDFAPAPESTIECSSISEICDIQLTTGIGSPADYYHIGTELRTISSDYTVRLHLSGYGGQVKGMNYLEAILKQTGAHVVSVVEGDVYSAHAFLSVIFDEIEVMGDYTMIFHTGSHYNEVFNLCFSSFFRDMIKPDLDYSDGSITIIETKAEYLKTGFEYIKAVGATDRGQDAFKKCLAVYGGLSTATHALLLEKFSTLLTDVELAKFSEGGDVLIPALEIQERLER